MLQYIQVLVTMPGYFDFHQLNWPSTQGFCEEAVGTYIEEKWKMSQNRYVYSHFNLRKEILFHIDKSNMVRNVINSY